MVYLPEPPESCPVPLRRGVLLINLGTPDSPSTSDVRRYLREFLSDPRVVEQPRWLWWLILNGIILNSRPKRSARKYASIWLEQGSPLLVHTVAQTELLQKRLGTDIPVACAMRYGQPAISQAIERLRQAGVNELLILPLYPQYAASTCGSALDGVFDVLRTRRYVPTLRAITSFHDHPGYIAALAAHIHEYWQQHGRGERLLMSFHGLPQRTITLGDPYEIQCRHSAQLLAEALRLSPDQWVITFQSRFGKEQWLHPYTSETLHILGQQKLGRLDVICPGFVADCLETLEEIAIEGRNTFQQAGGGEYMYIPCLNTNSQWIDVLETLVRDNMSCD